MNVSPPVNQKTNTLYTLTYKYNIFFHMVIYNMVNMVICNMVIWYVW